MLTLLALESGRHGKAPPEFLSNQMTFQLILVRMDSGLLRVVRGGSGAKPSASGPRAPAATCWRNLSVRVMRLQLRMRCCCALECRLERGPLELETRAAARSVWHDWSYV